MWGAVELQLGFTFITHGAVQGLFRVRPARPLAGSECCREVVTREFVTPIPCFADAGQHYADAAR